MKNNQSKINDAYYAFDPEIKESLEAMGIKTPIDPATARSDWQGLRENLNTMFTALTQNLPVLEDVSTKAYKVKTDDQKESIDVFFHEKRFHHSKSAIIYVHGGGRIAGSARMYEPIISGYVNASGVSMLAVDYRLSPEVIGSTAAEDTFAALKWLHENAAEFGLDTDRIAIMGDSGGGGIAAAVAIMARDANIRLAHQILIYPMLDDRNTQPDIRMLPFLIWTYDNNYTGWFQTLGKEPGGEDVSPLIAPARLKDFIGLAPTYIEVGFLDIFRNECIAYAQQLSTAGVPVEFHLYAGVPHAFEALAHDSAVVKAAMANRIRVMQSI